MNTRLVEVMPAKVKFTDGWPRIYRIPDPIPGRTLPPEYQTYYLCVKPYGGERKDGMDGGVVMFSLNGGLKPRIYTDVANIERDVAAGKLEQVPNGLRLLIELEP